ncbi:unnamed protein product [Linum tenue]|uniref:Uncharacterized protein n=1 Tax=Linum tenue TaxID=586396 RepID=A0AAV0NCQ1_9ROSI|nr:unnamed protein product [Linum tenue]
MVSVTETGKTKGMLEFSEDIIIGEYEGIKLRKATVNYIEPGCRCEFGRRIVRSVTGSQAIASEMVAFQRARDFQNSYVLSSVAALPEGDTTHFLYGHFDMDLQQYVEEIGEIIDSNGVMNLDFLLVMRKTFRALHGIHIEYNQNHNNLKWDGSGRHPLNIVVLKYKVQGVTNVDVRLTGLGDQEKDSSEFRTQDCQDLADILTTLVQKYSADNATLPFWFEALMRHLRTVGCLNLHNSLFFYGADLKLQYLYGAFSALRRRELLKEFDKEMLDLMCKTSKQGSWNPREHIMSHPNFSYIFKLHHGAIPYTSIASCFLQHCYNLYMGDAVPVLPWNPVKRSVVPSSERYEMLHSMWPEFFYLLPQTLAKLDVSTSGFIFMGPIGLDAVSVPY